MNPDIYLSVYKFFGVLCGIFFCCSLQNNSDQVMWVTLALLALYGVFVTGMHQVVGDWAMLAPIAVWVVLALLCAVIAIPFIGWDRWRDKQVTAKIRTKFPQVGQYHLECMIGSVRNGGDLDVMRWDGENVLRNEGSSTEKLTSKGWRPLVEPVKPYPYLKERTLVNSFLASYGVEVSAESNHSLCSLLYFNWKFEAAVVDGDSIAISMSRRDEARTDRYGCVAPTETHPGCA